MTEIGAIPEPIVPTFRECSMCGIRWIVEVFGEDCPNCDCVKVFFQKLFGIYLAPWEIEELSK